MPSTNETYLIWKMSNGLQSQFGVYGQKFSSDGTRQWGNDGKVFQPLGSNSMEKLLCLTKDTSVIYSFNESITGGINNIIKGFTTDRNGNIGWGGYIHTVSNPSSEKLKLVGIVNSNKMTMLAWSDRRLDGGGIYAQNINSNGTLGNLTGINNISSENPECITLNQNYPNPFNPTTIINYQLSKFSNVSLKVYDVLGNEIKTLVNEYKPAGNYSVTFDAGDTGQGNNLSSGIYFYTLNAGLQKQTKSMLLIK
ncbi:MAG: T9SS type A sorting domain-containing protein [Ignavibacteria bacterium]|nr:T9SS type A sorting domain-containing protein [Ignavibacteria bacterium]